jgi:hypothetical protein
MENENTSVNQPTQPATGQKPLPNATGVLVMGIISIATCWCYGVPGITLGIISLILGGKGKRLYKANPSQYTVNSYSNLKAGNICAIIGLSLSALFLIYIIVVLLFFGLAFGTAASSMPWDSFDY